MSNYYRLDLNDDAAQAFVYDLRNDGSELEKEVARQIEQQIPKPPPPEPEGDALVLVPSYWPPFTKHGGMWTNQDGYQFDTWDELTARFPRAEFLIYRPESPAPVCTNCKATDFACTACGARVEDS